MMPENNRNCAFLHTPVHTCTWTNLLKRYLKKKKSVSNNVNPERCRNVRHITWAGLAVGIWLSAGEASSPTNSSGTSCWGSLQGREQKGRRGRADIAYYVFPSQLEKASAVSDWDCWWFSVVRGKHKRKSSPFSAYADGEPTSPDH